MEGNLCFKTGWASLIVGSKFTVFALFYFVFEGNFPSTSPRGAEIWRGDLTQGFLRSVFEGLIHGGAWTFLAPLGIQLSIYTLFRDRSHVRSCPERSIQTFVFCPSLLLSATKTFIPAAPLSTRGNYFRPYLSISACDIEAQHSNDNCSTLNTARGLIKEQLLLLLLLSQLSQSLLVFFLCISRAQTMHLERQSHKSIILFIH